MFVSAEISISQTIGKLTEILLLISHYNLSLFLPNPPCGWKLVHFLVVMDLYVFTINFLKAFKNYLESGSIHYMFKIIFHFTL